MRAEERVVPPLPHWLKIGKKLRHHIGAVIARSSKVGDAPVYDSVLFPCLFLAAVRRSRFVQDARSSLGDWEKAMQKLERDSG